MPNWCNNYLELEHEDPAMIERARKAFNDGRLLAEFVPVPEDLQITASPGTTDEALRAQYDRNVEKHGYATWYEYAVNEWGTKWDVGGDGYEASDDGPNATTMVFDSAWAPPCAAMDKLMDLGFKATLYYYESGMCFAGIYSEDGDDFYELGNMTAEEVAEALPDELDIKFCISESMAEWEEDNQEVDDN